MTNTTSSIKDQAAEWLVRLSDEDETPSHEDYAQFEVWKKADPRHAQAVNKMEIILGYVQALPAEPAVAALDRAAQQTSDHSWAALAKILCLLAVVFLPLWLTLSPQHQLRVMLADKRTSTGEWQSYTLDDNSRLQLSSNSAINVHFTQQQRTVELVQGELLVDVASDAARPFTVTTTQGSFTALGTRFTVQRQNEASVLSVTESRVQARNKNSRQQQVITMGQRIRIDNDGNLSAVEILDDSYERAWLDHQLVVSGQPLSQVLEQLEPHYPGYLRFDAKELAGIRVYAVLPLDDPERALRLLSESFPIEVNQFTPWWASVSPKG